MKHTVHHPILTIIPNAGWRNGVNVNIVDANITDEEADDEDLIYGGRKMLAGPDTLIVKVRDMQVGGNHFTSASCRKRGFSRSSQRGSFGRGRSRDRRLGRVVERT